MEKIYQIVRIDGEYAILADDCGEELFIAMALLPPGVDEGTRLACDYPDFTVID